MGDVAWGPLSFPNRNRELTFRIFVCARLVAFAAVLSIDSEKGSREKGGKVPKKRTQKRNVASAQARKQNSRRLTTFPASDSEIRRSLDIVNVGRQSVSPPLRQRVKRSVKL